MRRQLGAALVVLLAAVPLGTMVLGALQPVGRPLPSGWELLSPSWSFDAFERAFDLVDLGTQLGNSATVVVVAVPLSVVAASWAGFAMVLLQERHRRLVLGLALVLLVVPPSAVWAPRFVLLSQLGLTDTLVPLVLPALMGTTPFAVLLLFWSARRIDRDLLDAARLSGLGPLRTWWRVAVPLTRPTHVAVAAIVFAVHWGTFVDALLFLYSPERFTLPLGMSQLRLLPATEGAAVLAGALVVTVPAALAFALVQRRFVSATKEAGWLGR